MKDSIRQWFGQAKEELGMAECLLSSDYCRGACYHSQQAIEKAIKGVLIREGWELERIHSIRLLTSLARRYGIMLKITEEDIDFIDGIYRGRYPAEEGLLPTGIPTKEDATRALRVAADCLQQLVSISGE